MILLQTLSLTALAGLGAGFGLQVGWRMAALALDAIERTFFGGK